MKQTQLLRWPLYIRWLILSLPLLAAFSLPHAARSQPAALTHTPSPRTASTLDSSKYWQQQVNYTIDVSLNETDLTLDGFARIQYINRSPDTLSFIWFHLSPNAFRNDGTAFSDQLLGNGRTDFYFSLKEQKGYINRLDFRVDRIIAKMEDHPQYIDIVKVILPRPLPPGGQTEITTPFHEKLPFNFSRGGYTGGTCQVTEWYPQPAVYDRYGWHPFPCLDQGGSYSEFGNFDVRITVPNVYTVAATGELATGSPLFADDSSMSPAASSLSAKISSPSPHASSPSIYPSPLSLYGGSAAGTRTLRFRQDDIQDFAWFAAKDFTVDHDTLQLTSGRVIDLYAYYLSSSSAIWKKSIPILKDAILFRSTLIGEYPYNVVRAVEIRKTSTAAMEYPTIVAIPLQDSDEALRRALGHELGYNWFYAILGVNARRYPWMSEGFSTYYDRIYAPDGQYYNHCEIRKKAGDYQLLAIDVLAAEKKDQPIATASEDLTGNNYNLITRYKAALWMKQLERSLGKEEFNNCMREYFRRWQFKHPYPEDFRSVIETTSHRQLDSLFGLLDIKGPVLPLLPHRTLKAAILYNQRNTDKINYINFTPALGYNHYDQFMIGALIHNLDRPPNRFQFLAIPLYAPNSHRLNSIGGLSYSWFPHGSFRSILVGLTSSRFSTLSGIDSNGNKIFGEFYKVVPTARLTLKKASARSTVERSIEWKTWLIGEKGFDNYVRKSTDSLYYPTVGKYGFRYLNQLSFNRQDQRSLYPYKALLQFQQASAWWRINFTGNYFFNYERGGGMALRFFAAKFGYLGGRNANLDLSNYEPKLTGVTGSEDYTYGNYFLGRNEFTGFPSQQIMMRDGGLKIRTDLFQGLQGRSDNWIAALNLSSSLPTGLLPSWLPLKVFLDIGTYAEAWQANPPTSRFLYVSGLQLTPFKYINFYLPLIYSSDFGNQLKTVPDQNKLGKKISFSIDFQTLHFGKKGPDNPF